MTRRLKPRESQALALVLLLLVIVLAAFAIHRANQLAHRHYDEPIESRLDQIARYRGVIASKEAYEQAILAVEKKDAGKYYLKTSTPSLAAADIQLIVQTLIEANALRLESMQIKPHHEEGGYRKVTLNFRVRGTLQALQQALHSIESAEPYLFVEDFSINSTVNPGGFKPTPGVEPEVFALFDVSGYARARK